MNRRTAVIVGVLVAAVLVVGGMAAGVARLAADGAAPSASSAATGTAPVDASPPASAPVDEQWIAEVTAALTAQDPERVATVMSAAVAAAYLEDPAPLLPSGVDLSVDLAGWTRTSETTAHVPAHLTGALQESWVLLLLREGDEWTVYGTSLDEAAP